VAFEAPANAKPYLVAVPPELDTFELLLRALGVRQAFAPQDFAFALRSLAAKGSDKATAGAGDRNESSNSGSGVVLDAEQLTLACSMAVLLGRCTPAQVSDAARACGGALSLPDSNAIMRFAPDLVLDDAPWLSSALTANNSSSSSSSSSLKFVHTSVPTEAAAALGVKSLRDKLLSAQADQEAVPCPAPAALRAHVTSALFAMDSAAAGASANAVAAADASSGGARITSSTTSSPPQTANGTAVTTAALEGVSTANATAPAAINTAAAAAVATVKGGPMGVAAVSRSMN